MPRKEEKQKVVGELRERFQNSKVAVLVNYSGLNVAAMTNLRRRLRESGIELKVAKNSLARIAAREVGLTGLDIYLEGPTAIAFGWGEPVAPAKILTEFIRDYKQVVIKGGILEGKIFQDKEISKLADLPAREILLGRVLGGLQTPFQGLVNVLQGNLRNLVYALEAIRKQRAGEVTG